MPSKTTPSAVLKRRRAPLADAPELRSIDYAAEFLDCHPRTVRRMLASGQINAYRVGRLVKVDMRQVYARTRSRLSRCPHDSPHGAA